MDVNALASQMRTIMYHFGKSKVLKPDKKVCMNPHDMMFISGIDELCQQDKKENMVKMSEISQHFQISAPAASQQIRRLESLGYVQRIQKENDRRSVYVSITKLAKDDIRKTEEEVNRNLRELVEYLGEEDTMEWMRLLKKITQFKLDKEETEKKGNTI